MIRAISNGIQRAALKKYWDLNALRRNVIWLDKAAKGSVEISGDFQLKSQENIHAGISLIKVKLIQKNKTNELTAIFVVLTFHPQLPHMYANAQQRKLNAKIVIKMDTMQKLAEVKELKN